MTESPRIRFQSWRTSQVACQRQPTVSSTATIATMANICQRSPIMRICSGIISRMVSRSSKMASTWILR